MAMSSGIPSGFRGTGIEVLQDDSKRGPADWSLAEAKIKAEVEEKEIENKKAGGKKPTGSKKITLIQ